jgi:hypothetical protein
MRGIAAFRTGVTPGGALAPSWVKNALWRSAQAVPSLDLRFAENKSLVDATTGQSLVTFTRASSGTFVGSDGLIKTATTNLATNSEDAAAAFTANTATVTANQIAAPTGAVTADQVTGSAGSANKFLTRNISATQTGAYTFSIYLKAGTESSVVVRLTEGSANGLRVSANLSNGTVSVTNEGTTASGQTGSIANVGGGWYRVVASCSFSSLPFSLVQPQIWLNTFGSVSLTTDFYLWGAQLEQSSTVGEYIPTTSTINSAPRFDHNPTTGESLGLLVEEQRTNLMLRSEEFDNASWIKAGLIAFGSGSTANAIAAPNGSITADLLTEDTSTGQHRVYQTVSGTVNTNAYTLSVYVKAKERTRFYVGIVDSPGFSRQGNAVFNLSNGTIFSASTGLNGATGGVASIQNVGDGWYRCSYALTLGGTNTAIFCDLNIVSAGSTISYTGDGTSGMYIWGAQLEAGAFPTSYIPTTTATVTRSADVASITGTNFSSWYRQDEGTVFAETQLPAGSATNTSSRTTIDLTDGSTNNRFNIRAITSATTADQLTIRSGAATTAQFGSNGSAVGTTTRKYAAAVKLDDFASWATGASTAGSDTSGAMPIGINQANIGGATGGTEFLSGTIRRLVYWGQRLPNSVLQTITQ